MNSLLLRMRQNVEQRTNDIVAILLLTVGPLIYFWPAALRQAVFFFGDIFLFFYPTHLAYADALRQGRLPLWDPRMLAGFPLFAEGQIGALYPLHPILYGLFPIDVATNYDILLHLSWVMLGMYLFVRALKLRPASAFLAAVTFGFGGFFIPRLQHMSVLATASWMPWLLWAWEKHACEVDRKKRWRWWVVLAVFSGIQLLGGHPQFAMLSVLLLGLYAIVRWERDEKDTVLKTNASRVEKILGLFSKYFVPSRGFVVVFAVGVGAMIAAAQLLPTYELSTISNRAAGLLPKYFNAFSLRLPHYLMLLYPFLLGNPLPHVSVETIGYVGLMPLTLAIAAPLVRRNRRVIFFVLIALVSLFLGLGDLNPLYRGMCYLPLFNYFRVPSRFFFWYTFAAAILAAFTFDYLLEYARATLQFTRAQKITLAIVVVSIAIVAGIVPAVPLESWLSMWMWLPIALAFVIAWIWLGARRGLFTRTTLATLVVGLTVIDLWLFAAVWSKTYDAMTPVNDFYQPPSTLAVLKNISPSDGRILPSTWIYPWMDTMRESMYPNVSLIYGIPSAYGYTPLLPQHTSDYIDAINAPMLDLMNVRYYVMPQLLPIDAKTEGADLENIFAPQFLNRPYAFTPTNATKIKIVSSLAQSVDLRDGDVVAQIELVTQDGKRIDLPLRAGIHTAEWAYERTDVRKVIKHSLPPIATTFPARSAFPTESHPGHNYLGEFDLMQDRKPLNIVGITITPTIPAGLLHIERVLFTGPDGKDISLAHLVGRGDQTLIYRTNNVVVFENQDVLPRAFLVHDTHAADDDAALAEMTRDDFNPQQSLILASGKPVHTGGVQTADESVNIVDYQPERVSISVKASTEGYLLLADAWFPGWSVRVDGVPVSLERGDLVFRAVYVPAGLHRVEFEYRSNWLLIGAAMGVLAVAILGVIVWRNR